MQTFTKYVPPKHCVECSEIFTPSANECCCPACLLTNKDIIKIAAEEKDRAKKEKIRKYKASWSDSNREIINRHLHIVRKRIKQRRIAYLRANPHVHIHESMSSGINASVDGNKNGRSWEYLVGYTCKELMDHLESQFQPGMTWDNHGLHGWHIDHIIPKAAFDITTTGSLAFKKCWALDNLQPLWAIDNLKKSDKIIAGIKIDKKYLKEKYHDRVVL